MGKLFIVSTPMGNLEDITLRALNILREVSVVFAEDTRSTLNLLHHHLIDTGNKRVISFFEGNEEQRLPEILKYLSEGIDVALVSESGTPLISDPGFKLARTLVEMKIEVEAIPGPTAAITALTVSGLPTNAFLFLGFLPKKPTHVKKVLQETKDSLKILKLCKTVIFYESPHRLLKTLNCVLEVCGDINIIITRELTKIHQEVRREKVTESIKHFSQHQPRGEFTILLDISA